MFGFSFFFFLSVSPFLGAVRSLYLLIPAFNVFFYHLRTSAGQSPSSSPKVSAELTLPKGECWTVGLWQQWHRWQTQRNYSMPSARRIRALSQARIVECLDSTSGVLVNGLKSSLMTICRRTITSCTTLDPVILMSFGAHCWKKLMPSK